MWRLLILLLLISESTLGREIIINLDSSTVRVTTQAGVAIDTSSNSSINQLSQANFEYDDDSINLGYTDAAIWIKLNIKNMLANPNLIININNPSLDKITLFQQFQGAWIKTDLGDLQKFHQRILDLPTFAIPISIKKNSSEFVYLRIQSINNLSIPMKVFSQNDFNHYLYTHYITFGVLYGIPLGLLLYNLLIFISTRKRTRFLYCLVILSNTFLSMSWDGITYSLLPESIYFQQRYISLAMCCGIITISLFSKSFLRTKYNTPKINTYLNITASSATILLLLVFLPNTNIFYIPIIVLTIFMMPGLLAAGIIRIRQQYAPARMYLLATSSFLLAASLCVLGVLNILPLQEEITYIYKIGVVSELILLSLGIAARIKALKVSEQVAVEKVRSVEKEKLEHENIALSKANNLKDSFLNTISHELRTPMNGVKGALGLLDIEHNKSNRTELINTISNSSDMMIKLIDRILLFTELKAGSVKNKPTWFSIHKLIENQSDDWYEQCNIKSIGFETHINTEKEILADQSKINWILTEIVANAIKFSDGGKICISIDLHDNNMFVISISDQGKGIPQELSTELTEFFRQEEDDFNRSYDGLGIGLSITSELVKLLDGKLTIETSKDFSTCIIIEIPIPNAELATVQVSKKLSNRNGLPLEVLIVEDNKVNQLILEKILKKLGHNTIVSNNGAEGYKAAQENQFDLILMDCQMPSMDGFECTELIRNSNNINRETLIIAITANTSETNKEHCLNSGMNDYRKKPIESSIIKELLDNYFSQAH